MITMPSRLVNDPTILANRDEFGRHHELTKPASRLCVKLRDLIYMPGVDLFIDHPEVWHANGDALVVVVSPYGADKTVPTILEPLRFNKCKPLYSPDASSFFTIFPSSKHFQCQMKVMNGLSRALHDYRPGPPDAITDSLHEDYRWDGKHYWMRSHDKWHDIRIGTLKRSLHVNADKYGADAHILARKIKCSPKLPPHLCVGSPYWS